MKIDNCTVAANSATNGSALACDSYLQLDPSEVGIRNSILWNGPLQVWNNDSSTITITYSDVEGGWADTGNIDENPLFVSGLLHDYYLSQELAGQATESPCVDAGSDTASNLGLDHLTTRTDRVPDKGTVDMGYHVYMLRIDSIERIGSNITIRWNALSGISYTVQHSTDMDSWTDVPVGVTNAWTDIGVSETTKYYRVLEQ